MIDIAKLEPDRDVIKIPYGKFTLHMRASGSGKVVVVYRILQDSVDFLSDGKRTRVVAHEASLKATGSNFAFDVRICRRRKTQTAGTFQVVATVLKLRDNGLVSESAAKECSCNFMAKEGSRTCADFT